MSSPDRYEEYVVRAAWFAPPLAVVLAAVVVTKAAVVPRGRLSGATLTSPSPEWAVVTTDIDGDWTRVRSHSVRAAVPQSSLANRFRLAGTFVAYGALTDDKRKAILDNLRSGIQVVVDENDAVDGIRVVKVYRDHVVLRSDGKDEALWLSFRPSSGTGGDAAVEPDGVKASGEGVAVPYGGKRVGEHRWVFSRDSLLDYYTELRDEPERLLAVFDSLEPLYDEKRKITGYRVNVLGEAQFFEAVGLMQGDVVRSVNSMKMTNRRRAEYFIKEFIYDRANAFVLDIERGNEPAKLVYQVR